MMKPSESIQAAVLVSGGLDSSVLLHYVVKQLGLAPVGVLSVTYGQRHVRELDAAREQVRALDDAVVEHRVVDCAFFPELAAGSSVLVRGGADVPNLSDVGTADRQQPPTYVPNRNMLLLSLAAAFAESRHCGTVYYGAQAQDEYGYWDCTPEFLARINAVLVLNRRKSVRVEAPFVDMSKSAIVGLGAELNVDFACTWSCYRGADAPCGSCPTCVERAHAFCEAGLADPLAASQ